MTDARRPKSPPTPYVPPPDPPKAPAQPARATPPCRSPNCPGDRDVDLQAWWEPFEIRLRNLENELSMELIRRQTFAGHRVGSDTGLLSVAISQLKVARECLAIRRQLMEGAEAPDR